MIIIYIMVGNLSGPFTRNSITELQYDRCMQAEMCGAPHAVIALRYPICLGRTIATKLETSHFGSFAPATWVICPNSPIDASRSQKQLSGKNESSFHDYYL